MGEIILRAASVGVQVILETHSDHVLNGIRLGIKQGIIDSARTQYLIETTARQTQEQTMTGLSALGTKIDFYEYQNLRDQLAQERTKNVVLENRVYSDAKFNAVEAQLASISCRMLPKPDVTGIGAVCPNAGIINGLGINSLNGGCNMV